MTIHPDTEPATHASAEHSAPDADVLRVPHPIHHPRARRWWLASQAVFLLNTVVFMATLVIIVNDVAAIRFGAFVIVDLIGAGLCIAARYAANWLRGPMFAEIPGAVVPTGLGRLGYAFTSNVPETVAMVAREVICTGVLCWLVSRHAGIDAVLVTIVFVIMLLWMQSSSPWVIDRANSAGTWIIRRATSVVSALVVLAVALSTLPSLANGMIVLDGDTFARSRLCEVVGVIGFGMGVAGAMLTFVFANREPVPTARAVRVVPTLANIATLALAALSSAAIIYGDGRFPFWQLAIGYVGFLAGVWMGEAHTARRRRTDSLPA